MKNLLTSVFVLLVVLSSKAQFADTTLVKLNRQITEGKWEHNRQYILVYDANKNLKSKHNQQWSGAWDNVFLETYTYDASNKLTEELSQRWFEGVWENTYQFKYLWKYDASGKKISGTRQNWKDGKWVNFQEHTFKYDASAKLQSELIETYDGAAKAKNGTPAKVKDELNTYAYDENGNVRELLHQRWHTAKAAWENRNRTIYSYDEKGNCLTETYEAYTNGAWVGEQNITRTMHVNGKFATETFEIPDGMGGFVNSKKQIHKFDLKKRLLKTDELVWNGAGWVPDNATQCSYKKN